MATQFPFGGEYFPALTRVWYKVLGNMGSPDMLPHFASPANCSTHGTFKHSGHLQRDKLMLVKFCEGWSHRWYSQDEQLAHIFRDVQHLDHLGNSVKGIGPVR